jgi:enediyne biosynthesis protein E4
LSAHIPASMKISRRSFLCSLPGGALAWRAAAQGVAARHARAQNRPPSSGRPYDAHFVDVARQAGLTAPVIYGEPDTADYILESVGCGCAFIDYDNDGWMDIFILGGTRLAGAPADATNRLYKNNRDGTFTDVTEKAGLHKVGWAASVCVGDYNNDGFDDLFCTYYGQNILYRNNGDGTFTDVTKQAGLLTEGTRWGAGCSFLDCNRDGHLDLFVSNYLQFDLKHVPKPGADVNCNWKGVPVECGPRGLPPAFHSLYRNKGDGTFVDVSKEAGISALRESYGMTVVCADLDEDGWPDIYVACDSTPSLLFMNNHDGTFREEGVIRGVAFNEDGMEQAGMGVGIGDYALDGHLDLFKTHFADDTNILYRNDGKGNFNDVTTTTKLGVETRFICWGTGIVDLDNDGFPDIFVVAGSVYPQIERKLPDYPNKCPRMLFRNLGNGTFEELGEEAGPALADVHCSRGCAFGDFDNDGDLDILIVNLNEPPSLLRNDIRGTHHWLKIKLVGTVSNRSAIGARVLVRYGKKVQAQALASQSSFYSSNDPRLHFGLGSETTADVEIHWPNGLKQELKGIKANQLVTVQEGKGIIPNKGWA